MFSLRKTVHDQISTVGAAQLSTTPLPDDGMASNESLGEVAVIQ
jgi:hypothetical protein